MYTLGVILHSGRMGSTIDQLLEMTRSVHKVYMRFHLNCNNKSVDVFPTKNTVTNNENESG
jgi:hypothetical protein